MFKRFQTKTKIRLGFVLVLALVAIFALFVVLANTTTISNVDGIREESELQSMTFDLASKLHEIDMKNQVLIFTFDEQAYQDGLAAFADCESKLAEMETHIDNSLGLETLRDLVTVTADEISLYKKNFIALQAANTHLAEVKAQAYAAEEELLSGCTGILDYQVELMREEASQVLETAAKVRRADRVETGFDIAQRFMTVASGFNVIFESFDFATYDENMQLLDETIAILQDFVDNSTLAYNIETGGKMLLSLTNFKDEVLAFRESNDACDASIAGAADAADKAQRALLSLSDELGAMIAVQVNGTVAMAKSSLFVIVAVSILLLVAALIVSEALSNNISKPISLMHTVIDQVGIHGDMDISDEVMDKMRAAAGGGDEVSQSISSFMNLIKHFSLINQDLSRMADGDLSFDVRLLSERDTIGLSMMEMMEKLNYMFGMADKSAHSVYSGSKQISEGSLTLASGSTQQAATVSTLTDSIHELAAQTRESTDMANKAAEITSVIKDEVEQGNRQMDSMVQAVKEINDASHSIDKVIGVIDDIAFQTNILALNASVEAARAGQHGKGFAVVAEEVRNLAAKSADAARDTSKLIADSISKADYGASIAVETAATLKKIVERINESTRLMDSVAESSNIQAVSIAQINEGIEQVSSVVQQNAAAAEQSAAASESMNSRALELQNIVEQFKLKKQSPQLASGNNF